MNIPENVPKETGGILPENAPWWVSIALAILYGGGFVWLSNAFGKSYQRERDSVDEKR